MNEHVLIWFFIFPFCIGMQNTLDFVSENIDFGINSQQFTINGIYYFVNRSDIPLKQAILFPFSEISDSVIVTRVYNLTYSDNLPFKTLNNAIIFKVMVLPKDTVMVNIEYSQKSRKENIYILESTQTWNNALQHVEYSLVKDKSVRIDSFSIAPDTLINGVYHWMKKDFFPPKNFIIWIK